MNLRYLRYWGGAVACVGTLFACGCMGDETPIISRDTGYLRVTWTIANEQTAELCNAYGASGAKILIVDPENVFVTEVKVPCTKFDTNVELLPDAYRASIVLVGEDDRPVSNRIDLGAFVMREDAELKVSASFAAPPP